MRIYRVIVVVLSVGLLAAIAVGTLPVPETQSQPVSDTQNASSLSVQNQSSSDAQSQPAADAQNSLTPQHEIIADDHIDVPEQTVTFRGNSYTVALIGRAEVEKELNTYVEGPETRQYSTVLVDPRRTPSEVSPPKRARGNSRPSFNTSGLTPGMHFVTVKDQNRMQAVHPVIVSAAETSISGPDCVGDGTSALFEVYVNEDQVGDISRVELVAFGQGQTVRTTAERERANLYRAQISFEDVPLTDAAMLVHAKVYAENGQGNSMSLRDVVGISQQRTLFVVEDEANCG